MPFLKKKVTFEEFTIIVYQFGFNVFNNLKSLFQKNQIEFNETLLFVVIETMISTLVSKQIQNNDIVDCVNRIVYEAFDDDNKNNEISYYVYIKDEIHDLVFYESYIKETIDYMLNEITECDSHTIDLNIVAFLCNIFGNLDDEIKNIISNIKIIN